METRREKLAKQRKLDEPLELDGRTVQGDLLSHDELMGRPTWTKASSTDGSLQQIDNAGAATHRSDVENIFHSSPAAASCADDHVHNLEASTG